MATPTPCQHEGPSGMMTAEELHVIHEHIEDLLDVCMDILDKLRDIHEELRG